MLPKQCGTLWRIGESLKQYAKLANQQKGCVFVDRDRDLREARGETQGILSGGEVRLVPDDRVTLFMLRTKPDGSKRAASWWPQIRFPQGPYEFAFAI